LGTDREKEDQQVPKISRTLEQAKKKTHRRKFVYFYINRKKKKKKGKEGVLGLIRIWGEEEWS
jgi:hypothetical protein